jgi:hypothetical protein
VTVVELNDDQRKLVKDQIARAGRRLDGAAAAASRKKVTEGEFDNNFDGVVTAIFHVVEAVEISRHGRMRAFGEGEESTVIRAVHAELVAAGVPDVPPASRLIDLNARRNTSIHGHWTEVLDRDGLETAITSARSFGAPRWSI